MGAKQSQEMKRALITVESRMVKWKWSKSDAIHYAATVYNLHVKSLYRALRKQRKQR